MLGAMVAHVLRVEGGIGVLVTARDGRRGALPFAVEDGREGLESLLAGPGRSDVVVNGIGVLSAAIRSDDSAAMQRAVLVNAAFPYLLAEVAGASGARVIHVSTDGVFATNRGLVYEDDRPDSDEPYGQSKHLGECVANHVLNVRCSIVGPDSVHGRGLVEWVRTREAGSELIGFTDQVWNGVTTRQLAQLCRRLLDADTFAAARAEGPVHHFCPNPAVSKHELVRWLGAALRPDLPVRATASGRPLCRLLATRFDVLARLVPAPPSLRDEIVGCARMQPDPLPEK